MFTRENIKLAAVAAFCLVVGLAAPAVSHGVNHALFAHNADKVDGKHAVGSGASINQRKGKVVATSPTSGRLPNNIIAKAPDSAKLGGAPAADTRSISISVFAMQDLGAVTENLEGMALSAAADGSLSALFQMPDDYTAGSPISVRVSYMTDAINCTLRISVSGGVSDPASRTLNSAAFLLPNGLSDWTMPQPTSGGLGGRSVTMSWTPSVPVSPGASVRATFRRSAESPLDTCDGKVVTVRSMLLRY